MDKSGISITNLKNLFGKFFHQNTDTVSVNEWSEPHQQIHDPRVSFLEHRIAGLEGGSNALAVKTLKSARFKIISNLLEKGENVVTFNSWALAIEDKFLYERIGVDIRLSEDGNINTFRSLVDSNTKLIYLETISIKYMNVPDFIKIISYARLLKIPVAVDNTASVGGYFLTPIKQKANLVIESLEDYLPRNTKLKAIIIEGETFNWFGGRFNNLSAEKIQFRHAVNGKELSRETIPALNLVDFLRKKASNGYNGYPIPHDPFSLIKKLEEIPEKIQKRTENAGLLAAYLKKNKHILKVNYTGFPAGTGYFEALKYFKYGFGFYLSFKLNEEPVVAKSFFEELKGHPAVKNRLTYDLNKSEAYLAVPGIEFDDLKEHFENSFLRLAEIIKHQYLIEYPWLEFVELA